MGKHSSQGPQNSCLQPACPKAPQSASRFGFAFHTDSADGAEAAAVLAAAISPPGKQQAHDVRAAIHSWMRLLAVSVQ